MRESTVEKHLVDRVRERGGRAYKFVSPGRRNVPDRLVLLPGGRPYFVETKAPEKSLRPGQARERRRIEALGFEVVVAKTKEEVDDFLTRISE